MFPRLFSSGRPYLKLSVYSLHKHINSCCPFNITCQFFQRFFLPPFSLTLPLLSLFSPLLLSSFSLPLLSSFSPPLLSSFSPCPHLPTFRCITPPTHESKIICLKLFPRIYTPGLCKVYPAVAARAYQITFRLYLAFARRHVKNSIYICL